MESICSSKFAQLDFLLMPYYSLNECADVRSLRSEALASQHFVIVADIKSSLERPSQLNRAHAWNVQALRMQLAADAFVRRVFLNL